MLRDAHVLTNCVKLYRFIFNSNEPAKVACLQKLGNQAMLNGALLIEMLNNYFKKKQEKLWSFDKAKNVVVKKKLKKKDMGREKYISTRFC